MHRSLVLSGCVLAALAVSACSGGGGSASGPSCAPGTLESPAPQLLYPIPGSTGVPSTVGVLLYANPSNQAGFITLGSGGSVPIVTASPTSLPSPLPSPIATPSVAGARIEAASFGPLASGAPVGVYLNVSSAAGCPTTALAFGSFQTQ